MAALARDRCEEALEEFAAAVPSAAASNKRGVALIALQRRAEALDAFCEALEHDERYAPALTNIGNLLLEDGEARDAVDHYRAALSADPAYAGAYRNLGVALRRTGRRAQAVRAWRVAARLEGRRAADRA
ncbi:MAG: tetratricopeptide repeat protein [Candidatus Eremiobacteraeota bacterium]|nr:tetratricopeptide repeat protein [Candidatus Eremiobacteraeota bacterium]